MKMPEYNEAEFRGTDNVWIAEVTEDSPEAYTAGTPVNLAPTGQISKTVNSSSETHYYSNVGMITIVTKGSDTVTITVPVLSLTKLGLLTGQTVDPTTGALITGELKEKYFAVMYRVQLTDNSWRYVTKYKCQLSQPPEEVSQTRSDGVNTNNQQLVFTCNKTIHEFENGGEGDGHADGLELDERDNLCDFDTFFEQVYTPDTIETIAKAEVTALTVTPSQLTGQVVGTSDTVSVSVTPSGTPVRWASSNPSVASVEPYSATAARVTMNGLGSAVITATSGSRSDSCEVSVTTEP
jgi:phi13 family phage major tail protein